MVKSPIVARINALLAEKGIPKQQFYKDCNITSASYSLWNTGKTTPRLSKLQAIADYLNVTVEDLLPSDGYSNLLELTARDNGMKATENFLLQRRISAVTRSIPSESAELHDVMGAKENSPSPKTETERSYVDVATKRIWSPAPVSILVAQYNVPSAVLADIAACSIREAEQLALGTSFGTADQLSRVASTFSVALDDLTRGWVPLYANPAVLADIARRTLDRFPTLADR